MVAGICVGPNVVTVRKTTIPTTLRNPLRRELSSRRGALAAAFADGPDGTSPPRRTGRREGR